MTGRQISHHLDASTLMCFAAGALPEALSAVVAAHVSGCAHCRATLDDMDLIGGALLDDLPGKATGATPDVTGLLRETPRTGGEAATVTTPSSAAGFELPAPIRAQYGLQAATIPWRRLGPGVWYHKLALSEGTTGDLRLLKIGPGRQMPEHGHGGTELTLVLQGAFDDATGHYGVGDIQDVDEDVEHVPLTDAIDGCICLVASERPARFKTLIGRILQPLTGGM